METFGAEGEILEGYFGRKRGKNGGLGTLPRRRVAVWTR